MKQPSILDQAVAKLNGNKNAITASMAALGGIEKKIPNLLVKSTEELSSRISPRNLIGENRRAKNSVPIGKLRSGSILYSDGSIRQDEAQPSAVDGHDFANLQLAAYHPLQEPFSQEQESPVQDITQQFMNPLEAPQETEAPQPVEAPKNAFEAFMQLAGRIPVDLKKEIDDFLTTSSDQDESVGFQAPEEKIIASRVPVRYDNNIVQPKGYVRGLPSFRAPRIDDLLSKIEEDDF